MPERLAADRLQLIARYMGEEPPTPEPLDASSRRSEPEVSEPRVFRRRLSDAPALEHGRAAIVTTEPRPVPARAPAFPPHWPSPMQVVAYQVARIRWPAAAAALAAIVAYLAAHI